ncbi:hypothetical protein PN36_35085 [Candidatus Thiomargarita nelsonii]|uniref:Uncharacterized protein n=1 Tax=Candidatus Thiomargarita nelsonii TaxID=1003181 RepID=A0A4E0RAJ6_9GAMM|nr:hypothetical protein PN36_35085 [Candidatus Thiomargarita nelsonii]
MSYLSSISQQALEAFVGNQEQEASPEEKPSEKEILPTEEEASAFPSKEEETKEVSSEEASTEDIAWPWLWFMRIIKRFFPCFLKLF